MTRRAIGFAIAILVSSGSARAVRPRPPDLTIRLKVADAEGVPIDDFQALARANGNWCVQWRDGSQGRLTLTPDDFWCGNGEEFRTCEILIRAPGYASRFVHLDTFEGTHAINVRMTPGRVIEIVITSEDGRALPESLEPDVYFKSLETSIWLNHQIRNGKMQHFADATLMPVTRRASGRFTFHLAEDAPEFYVLIDEPGFLRSFRSGPHDPKTIEDEKIAISLPEPAKLNVSFARPLAKDKALPFSKTRFRFAREIPDGNGSFFIFAFEERPDTEPWTWSDLFAHGTYLASFSTVPGADHLPPPEGKPHPGAYRDSKRLTLRPGESREILFEYIPYDEDGYKGDHDVVIETLFHDGRPAAGLAFKLTYSSGHYASRTLQEGELPADGRIELSGVRGGKHPREGGPAYMLEIADGSRGRFFIEIGEDEKRHKFEFRLPPDQGDSAPELLLTNVFTDEELKISDYRGRWVYLEFWATWCGPCRPAMDELTQIVSRRQDDWRAKAAVLAVSIDAKRRSVTKTVKERAYEALTHVWSGEGGGNFDSLAAITYGISGVPTSLLIDPEGVIAWRGYPNEFDLESELDERIDVDAPR